MEMKLSGKVALVTGAGKRLGRAVALRLANEGADVAVHYRGSEAEAAEVVAEIEKLGRRGVAMKAELTSVEEIRGLVQRVAHEFGRIDMLVNSAANFLPSSVISTTEEVWDASLDANVKGPFFLAQAAAPWLRRTGGVIVNFADTGGILGWPGYIAHSVSKAGMIMLTKTLAKALAPEVRVNAIAPGTITMPGDPPEWEQEFVKNAPLKKTGTPSDIADAVSYLVSARFLTGHVLVLDGGRTLA
ncbi:MAG TPA: SDR family oxidoreductase [Candidatus Eremiobacteraceae bacterium]|nr:SDR family oxidoreductase [Candidatus Eremiobacteraceae bacterium]